MSFTVIVYVTDRPTVNVGVVVGVRVAIVNVGFTGPARTDIGVAVAIGVAVGIGVAVLVGAAVVTAATVVIGATVVIALSVAGAVAVGVAVPTGVCVAVDVEPVLALDDPFTHSGGFAPPIAGAILNVAVFSKATPATRA
jgi:hypothetical protein